MRQSNGARTLESPRQATTFALAGVVVLLLVAVAGWDGWRGARQAARQEDASVRLLQSVDALERATLAARAAHRAYLLSPDSASLAAFRAANGEVLPLADSLAAAAGAVSGGLVPLVGELRQHVRTLGRLRIAGAEARTEGLAAAAAVLQSPEAASARAGAEELFRDIRRLESGRRAARHLEAQRAVALIVAAVVAAVGIALVFAWRTIRLERREVLHLSERETRLRAIQDSLGAGLVVRDAAMRMVDFNPAALRILGMSEEELRASEPNDPRWLIRDESGAPATDVRKGLTGAVARSEVLRRVISLQKQDGTTVWLRTTSVPLVPSPGAEPIGVVGLFEDITEEREGERRLAESEARYRLIADSSTDLVSLRSPEGRFLYASPSHLPVLGWAPEELIGRMATDLLHPDDVPLGLGILERLRRGEAVAPTILRARHRDGHWVTFESVASLQYGLHGTIESIRVAARDISERRLLEEQARLSLKREALGRMAAGVAHDFNNILTVVRGAAGMLSKPDIDAVSRRELAREIEDSVARAAILTTQLLRFARAEHARPSLVPVAEHARRVFPLLVRLAGRAVTAETSMASEAELAVIRADATLFDQALLALVLNAREAMPTGGRLRLALRQESVARPRPHRHGTIPAGNYLVVEVADSGSGIPEDIIKRVFDPFFTTKEVGEGSGLGLSAALGIAEQAGGSITIESTVGQGTTACLYWPLAEADEQGPSHEAFNGFKDSFKDSDPSKASNVSIDRPALRDAPPHIALIDDEPTVLQMMQRLLEGAGYRVSHAMSGEEGLALIRRERATLQGVVSDVRMPGTSGVAMVNALLAEGIDLPLLLLSGQLDDPIPSSWPATVTRRFLAKPFTNEDLLAAVQALLAPAPLR